MPCRTTPAVGTTTWAASRWLPPEASPGPTALRRPHPRFDRPRAIRLHESTPTRSPPPMKTAEIWTNIHAERAALADTWEGLTPDQWLTSSWCGGWSVHVTAGHVLAAAEQTIPNFYKEFV